MTTFTVSLTINGLSANDPLDAAKRLQEFIEEGDMIYDVIMEENGRKFTVDLAEEDEDAVLSI